MTASDGGDGFVADHHAEDEITGGFDPYKDLSPEDFLDIAIRNKRRQVREIAASWQAEQTNDAYAAVSSIYTVGFDDEATFVNQMVAAGMGAAMVFSFLSVRDEYRNAMMEMSILVNLQRYAHKKKDPSVIDQARPLIIMRATIPDQNDANVPMDVRLSDDISAELLDIIDQGEADTSLARRYTLGSASSKFSHAARKIKEGLHKDHEDRWGTVVDSGKLFRTGVVEMGHAIVADIGERAASLVDAWKLANKVYGEDRKPTIQASSRALKDGRDMFSHPVETYRELTAVTTYEAHQNRIDLSKGRMRRYASEEVRGRFGGVTINEDFYPKAEVQLIRALGKRESDLRSVTRQRAVTSAGLACTLAFSSLAFIKGAMGLTRGAMHLSGGNLQAGSVALAFGVLDCISGHLNLTSARALGERSVELQNKDRQYGKAVMDETINLFEHRLVKIERERERIESERSAREGGTDAPEPPTPEG